ncbi:hypothetical protein DL98DRAFT_513537 [Cadophora sp. DSE1049]|nr:hypothetical protein DL98DRAFT_513537 [Cadophora sp. DSE1049]
MEPLIYDERHDPTVTIEDQEVVHRNPQLIIYQDELNLILNDLEPFLRPAFLKRQITSELHEMDDHFAYIFPSPEFEQIVPHRPTCSAHEYGYKHLKRGTRFSRGIWDVTSTRGTEQNLLTEDEWRFWWDLDRIRQEAEKEKGSEKVERA